MADFTVIVDGIAITYSQAGNGADVLLLHGWGDKRQTFTSLSDSLQKTYRVTALDLPGFGGSEPPKEVWDLTNYAKFLESFCNKLQIKPKLVVGHSNGGALAIHAIATKKLNTDKLVLLAPSGVRNTKILKRAVIKTIAKTGKLATFWLPLAARRRLQMKLYGTVGSDMLAAPQLKETFKRTVRQDIQNDARNLKLPALLIYGSKDTATSLKEVGEPLARCIEGSKLVVIPGAGHFVHHDAAVAVEQHIKEFI